MAETDWLVDLFHKAKASHWCMSLGCTTCGSMEFRTAFVVTAAQRAGMDVSRAESRNAHPVVSKLNAEELAKVFETMIRALRALDARKVDTDGLEVLLHDLNPPMLRWGALTSLKEALKGSSVGDWYESELEWERMQRARAREREFFESPGQTVLRRAEKRAARASEHENRVHAGALRGARRTALLAELAGMNDAARLAWLAGGADGAPIDMLPADLIPTHVEPSSLDRPAADTLLRLIGARRGPWRKLRESILACLAPNSPDSSPT